MARPREVQGLRRDYRVALYVDPLTARDLESVAEAWGVALPTACYWLLRGLVSDARGERFVMAGADPSERLSRWLVSHFGEGPM